MTIWLDLIQCKTVGNGWIFQLKQNNKDTSIRNWKNSNRVKYKTGVELGQFRENEYQVTKICPVGRAVSRFGLVS